jgi:hypothetical protein
MLAPALLLTALNCAAQNENKEERSTDVIDITKFVFSPGFSGEKRIGKNQTLYGKVFPALSLSYYFSDGLGSDASFYIDPAITLQYRYYYNGRRRQRKGKRTAMNSMNYIGPVYRNIFSKRPVNSDYYEEDKRRLMNTLAVVWGLQRNFRSRISIDFNVGPGYNFSKGTEFYFNGERYITQQRAFTLFTQFDIGIWLNRKRA